MAEEASTTTAQVLFAAGTATADTEEWDADSEATPDLLTAVVPTGYQLASLDLTQRLTGHRAAPKRVRGTVTLTDGVSWLTYFAKHGSAFSEVYGDVNASTVTAVLNAPKDGESPAWGDHRAVLKLEHTDAWQAWTRLDGQYIGQESFAEHIEARTPDLVEPSAAEMLELAQTFQATKGVNFESGTRLANGQRRFTYAETIEGRAGQRGQIDVPTQISLRVQVWRGVDIAVPMTARFRYRIGRDGLALGIVLDRLDDVLDAAWGSLLGDLTAELPVPVLAGQAPTYA